MASEPPPSYTEIAELLDMPIGSIGPTRARALGRIRSALDGAGVRAEDVLGRRAS